MNSAMSSAMNRVRALSAIALFSLASCAILGKGEPVVPRYFTPMESNAAPMAAQPKRPELHLRLGRIEGLSHLREPMVIRATPQELTYDESRRWTERPEVYLRESLTAALFQQRGITEVIAGPAVRLDAELTAFEEIAQPQDRVRLAITWLLHDDRAAIMQDTIALEVPIAADTANEEKAQAVVDAYAKALRDGVAQLADRVETKLSEAR